MKNAVPPLIRYPLAEDTLTVSDNTFRCTGRARLFLLLLFRKATPGGISARFPTALHRPAALWREGGAYFIPSLCLPKYRNKNCGICQEEPVSPSGLRTLDNEASHRPFPTDEKEDGKSVLFCMDYSRSISSALRRVVSVMLVPPMMRASSRFLPSISRGVTEV